MDNNDNLAFLIDAPRALRTALDRYVAGDTERDYILDAILFTQARIRAIPPKDLMPVLQQLAARGLVKPESVRAVSNVGVRIRVCAKDVRMTMEEMING